MFSGHSGEHNTLSKVETPPAVVERALFQDVVRRIEETDSEDEMRESLDTFLSDFKNVFHTDLKPEVTSIYNAMERERLLLRVERLSAIVDSVLSSKEIRLGGASKDYYANAVIANNEGVRIAMAEGEAPGPVRLVMGFNTRSAIGFDPKGLEVHDVKTSDFDLRDTGLRSALCRHVEGNLSPEAVKYLVMRLPTHLVADRHLTDTERTQHPDFVFRGATFSRTDAT